MTNGISPAILTASKAREKNLPTKVSLSEFLAASEKDRTGSCAICCLDPEMLAEVNAALRSRTHPPHKKIGEWLREQGVSTTPTYYHFNSGHHLEDQ